MNEVPDFDERKHSGSRSSVMGYLESNFELIDLLVSWCSSSRRRMEHYPHDNK